MSQVSGDEVLLLWRALSHYRCGPDPSCRPEPGDPGRGCPLAATCPRWGAGDDHALMLDESVEQTERRRAAWPCSRLLDLLGPETMRIGR